MLTCTLVESRKSRYPMLSLDLHLLESLLYSFWTWSEQIVSSTLTTSTNRPASVQVKINIKGWYFHLSFFVTSWHENSLFRLCAILSLYIEFLFTVEQLEQIQKVSLAQIICYNSDYSIKEIQPKVFLTPDEYVILAFSNIIHFFKSKKNFLLCTIIFLLHFLSDSSFVAGTQRMKLEIFYKLLSFLNKPLPCAKIPGIYLPEILPLWIFYSRHKKMTSLQFSLLNFFSLKDLEIKF